MVACLILHNIDNTTIEIRKQTSVPDSIHSCKPPWSVLFLNSKMYTGLKYIYLGLIFQCGPCNKLI